MKINENVFFAKISITTLKSGTKLKKKSKLFNFKYFKNFSKRKIMKMFFLLKTVSTHLYQVQKLKEMKTVQF